MSINGPRFPSQLPGQLPVHGFEGIFELNTKSKRKIEMMAKGLAEVAYSAGETNSKEQYASEMVEDLIDVIKKVKKKKKRKKR